MKLFSFLLLSSLCISLALVSPVEKEIMQYSVQEMLNRLGDNPNPNYVISGTQGSSIEIGQDLVLNGFSKRKDYKKAKRQSKHFVCTSCHNIQREDFDLANPNPQKRLEYTTEKGIPYLQASPLYGLVNRTSFYNGDYEKKYGELVKPARNNIREAIQLCAVECAQGRKLKAWEIESIVKYLWTIDLKMTDLLFTENEIITLGEAVSSQEGLDEAIALVKSKYKNSSDAHFRKNPDNWEEGYDKIGDPDNGKLIYENSCLHCHYEKKYSYFDMDNSKMLFKYLNKKASKYSRHSIYQLTAYGTFPKHGKHSYMPLYTEEKMTDQQVEDLRAYFKKMAG